MSKKHFGVFRGCHGFFAVGFILLVGFFALVGCSSSGNNGNNGQQPTRTSYVGTTGVFVAWANGFAGTPFAADIGTFAGKRQMIRGTIDPITAVDLGQLAGVEI